MTEPLRHKDIVLVPYVEVDGSRVIPDSFLKEMWGDVREQKLDVAVFGEEKPVEFFLSMLKSRTNLPVFIFQHGETSPLGFAWLNGIKAGYAFAHFIFLKDSWGRQTLDMGVALCKYWFSLGEKPLFETIVGNIPSSNRQAISFVKKLGWAVVGEIPHLAHDGAMTVTYCERQEFSRWVSA